MKKKVFSVLLATVIVVSLTGCAEDFPVPREEMSSLNMVRAIGIDKGMKDPNNICITLISEKPNTGTSAGQQGSNSLVLTNEAPTIFEAEREFETSVNKQIFFGHIDYFLIGEDAAKEGIAKYIDFLARDHEVRSTSKVYIVMGTTAKDFIEKTSTDSVFMPERLKAISENAVLTANANYRELLEFMQWLNNKYCCALAPTLYLTPKQKEIPTGGQSQGGQSQGGQSQGGQSQGGQSQDGQSQDGQSQGGQSQTVQPSMEVELGGYAIFKDLKLVTVLDTKMTRGENLILSWVRSGVIQVQDLDGELVALEIIDSSSSVGPVFEKGELKGMKVKVKISSNIDEVHSTSPIFNANTVDFFNDQQKEIVKDEIEQVISFAQAHNTDFVNMSNQFEINYPAKWVKYKNSWEDIFPTLPISVEVESKINRTYSIVEPNGIKEDDHK